MNFIKVPKKYLIASGVISSACFVILLLAYMFIVRPQKNAKRLVESRLAEKQQVYESALRAAKEETKIRLNEQIESLQNRLKDFVAEFEDSATLTFDLSQIAEEKKVASFGSKVKTNRGITRNKDEYKYIHENQINISFTGDWNQFATFLNSLERHRPIIFVDQFTIARAGQDEDESVFRVNLNVAALVRKQPDSETDDNKTGQVYGKKI